MPAMDHPVIPIRAIAGPAAATAAAGGNSASATAADSHAGCGACSGSIDNPACQARVGQTALPAMLSGPPAELQRLLAALAGALGFPPGQPEAGGVRSLQVGADEVELTLATAPGCGGGALLTDAAFQTLRRLLPDTDIYIRHAA
jgi:hypothetical protein